MNVVADQMPTISYVCAIWVGMADEERHLVRFFGQDYVDFRNKVGTWLPAGLVAKAAR